MPHSSTASDPKKVYSQEYYVHFVLRVHLLRMFVIQNIPYTNLKNVLFKVPTCAHLIRFNTSLIRDQKKMSSIF